jgi:hypothetical protein
MANRASVGTGAGSEGASTRHIGGASGQSAAIDVHELACWPRSSSASVENRYHTSRARKWRITT